MISAVVLSHNNASIIRKTLESLVWCDEILVIDDDSTDETKAVAEKIGARVIHRPLANDFAAQRNFALGKTKSDWVLFIDSDEIVSKHLSQEIQKAIQDNGIDGYFLKREDILFGEKLRYGETAAVRLLRLGRKEAGVWERPVHEVWNITTSVKTLQSPLEHYPHQTMTEFLDDINMYSTQNAKLMFSEGKRVGWFEIVAYPTGKFLQNYLLRQGFRDGMRGAILAIMMSFHSFLTRGKLYALQHKQPV